MKKYLLFLLVLLAACPAFSATRFYLPSSGTPEISPTPSTSWDRTTDMDRVRCTINKFYTVSASKTSTTNATLGTYDNFVTRQYISNPIGAQTISGYVSGEIRVSESSGNANAERAVIIRVFSKNGATSRGTLLSTLNGGSEYNTSLRNLYFPARIALTTVTSESGDRIVIEIGTYARGYFYSSYTITHSFGDDNASDLPVNQTETNAYNPWIEFSQDIRFPGVRYIK